MCVVFHNNLSFQKSPGSYKSRGVTSEQQKVRFLQVCTRKVLHDILSQFYTIIAVFSLENSSQLLYAILKSPLLGIRHF